MSVKHSMRFDIVPIGMVNPIKKEKLEDQNQICDCNGTHILYCQIMHVDVYVLTFVFS